VRQNAPTPIRPSIINGVILWVFGSSIHLVIAIAALLLALFSVLCLVLMQHGEGDAAGKYERVSLMVRRKGVDVHFLIFCAS